MMGVFGRAVAACTNLQAAVEVLPPAAPAATRARYLSWVRPRAALWRRLVFAQLTPMSDGNVGRLGERQLGEAWVARGNFGEGDGAYAEARRILLTALQTDAASVPDGLQEFLDECQPE